MYWSTNTYNSGRSDSPKLLVRIFGPNGFTGVHDQESRRRVSDLNSLDKSGNKVFNPWLSLPIPSIRGISGKIAPIVNLVPGLRDNV